MYNIILKIKKIITQNLVAFTVISHVQVIAYTSGDLCCARNRFVYSVKRLSTKVVGEYVSRVHKVCV